MKLKLFPDRIIPELITWPWRFPFTYLIWQSPVTSSQTSYLPASFVNVVFSDDDKILIKKLYQLKAYNAKQLRKEFPFKGWTKSSINRLLKKFRDTGTVDRRQGSGRPISTRTDENTDQVNDMVLSQEDQPRTHSTVREISRGTGFPKSSVVRIIKRIYSWNTSNTCAKADWGELDRSHEALSEEVFRFVVVLFIICFFFSGVKELWKSVKISPSFKANKIKHVFKSTVKFSPNLDSNFPR